MPRVIRIQQVAGEGQQFAAVLGLPVVVERVKFLQPLARAGDGKGRGIWRQADLAAAQLARDMHHLRQICAGMHSAGIEQRLVRHHQAARARLRLGDRGNQMGVDALAITDEIGELLANRRQFVETGLLHVPQCRPDHQIGGVEDAKDVREG